jgi:hypothetical protein
MTFDTRPSRGEETGKGPVHHPTPSSFPLLKGD